MFPRRLAFIFAALLVSTNGIPHQVSQTTTLLPTSVAPSERDAIGDVATIIGTLKESGSTESSAPQQTCLPCLPSPWQPLLEWWVAFSTSATTFTHPLAIPFVWLVVAGVMGLMGWGAMVTFRMLGEIWSVWLKVWLSPEGRAAGKQRSASIQANLTDESCTQPEEDVKRVHEEGTQTMHDQATPMAFATASSAPVTRKRLNSQASGVDGALEIFPGPPKKCLSTGSTSQHTSNDAVNEFDKSGPGEEDAVSEDEPAGDGGSKNIGADSGERTEGVNGELPDSTPVSVTTAIDYASLALSTVWEEIILFQGWRGRFIGRYVLPVGSFKDVIEMGLSQRHNGGAKLTSYQENLVQSYHRIIHYDPELERHIRGAKSPVQLGEIIQALEKGRKSARGDDVQAFKENVGIWPSTVIDWGQTAYNRSRKNEFGFNNPVTGSLLCPVTMDWSDYSICDDLQSQRVIPTSDDLPRFLWPGNEPVRIGDLASGFLRSQVLEAAFKTVWIAPSTVLGAGRAPTRSSKATMYGVNQVTIESIAYVAMLMRFVLSDQGSFSIGSVLPCQGAWCLGQFCLKVIDQAYNTLTEEEFLALVQWWNETIFPDASVAMSTRSKKSAAGLMEAQCAAKLANLDRSYTRTSEDEFEDDEGEEEPMALYGQGIQNMQDKSSLAEQELSPEDE
ncbi:hypothetical protein K488DRAFT_81829 [Vararia minispora EC-137]|uniref:Uncharacterized protein n=1 Tax=Vararia minispora EC-137 TaxID=1314806 RepID=A0ACB8QYN9_9AGAM|nr:hypothetical protein K488DRAFT_81829 [Vararia minispora EC-137]